MERGMEISWEALQIFHRFLREDTVTMQQFETEMHLYLTNLRVETQAVGILPPQTYRRHWIKQPDIQIQTEMLAPDPRKLNEAGVML